MGKYYQCKSSNIIVYCLHELRKIFAEQNLTKRPPTPIQDQPQTPQNVSSRPQTPRMPSRPSTPLQFAQRHSTPVSRPNTPQRSAPLNRPKTPTMPIRSLSRPVTPVISFKASTPKKDENSLKSSYFEKQKQFHRMKRELDLKQVFSIVIIIIPLLKIVYLIIANLRYIFCVVN